MTDQAVTRLLAKQEIEERMLRYARAADRHDWAAMRETFHPDAEIRHRDYQGGVDGLIALITGRQQGVTISLHLMTNCLVEFVSDSHALAETYLLAYQWLDDAGAAKRGLAPSPDGVGVAIDSWGRYVDEFTLRDGTWRVQRRQTVFESFGDRPAIGRRPVPPHWLQGVPGADDPLNQARARLGLA